MAVTINTNQYWQKTLEGLSLASPVIIDKSIPEAPIRSSGIYESVRIELSDPHIAKIASFIERNGLDTKTLWHGIWALLVFRYGAGDEIVYGCVDGGTPKTPVPVRVKISSSVAASSWLHELQSYLDTVSQQFETPFDEIHELSGINDDMPVFMSAIDLSEEDFDASGFAEMRCPLVFRPDLRPTAGELSIHFDPAYFEHDTLRRMLGHIDMLLSGILGNEQARVANIPILTPAEFNQIVYEWNRTQADYPSATCLHQLFEEQVEQDPEAVAIIFRDQHLTYAELNRQANQLAHYLISLGVGPDRLVGVCMERSLEMSVALLAILKAGGAYVPLDPVLPDSRLAFILEDIRAEVVLTQTHLQERIASDKVKILCLDDDTESWAHQETTNPRPTLDADNLFSVIFTSGSTGKPKGVMVPHRGIINLLQCMQNAYPLDFNDRVLQKAPYSFAVSVWELFWALTTGAKLVYAKPEGHRDPEYLRDLIIEQGITTLHFVPSMLRMFLQTPDVEKCVSLRRVLCGGEALQMELVRLFFERLRHTELHNRYGPTEASVDAACFACQPNETYRSVPIGKPTPNTELYVLDPDMNPVPVGVAGELYIGGVQLARGYLNRDDLTQNAFVENPFFEEGHLSKRLYKSGDQARYQPDGNIEFLGRLDSQVKIRGIRIELGEIEAALNESDMVQSSVVVVHEDLLGNKKIAAYIIPEPKHLESAQEESKAPQTETSLGEIKVQEFVSNPLGGERHHKLLPELRESLKTVLPEYMIPSNFMLIEQIPLLRNGKLDRNSLPLPDIGVYEQGDYLAAENEIEETLVRIWSDVLGLDRVGVTDSFLELGGDSILSIQVVNRARKCNLNVTLSQLFEHNTIRKLSKVAEWRRASGAGDAATTTAPERDVIKRIDRSGPLELSLGQQQLWFLSRLDSESAAYVFSYSIRLLGPLDVRSLEQSLNRVIERHEILRTTYYDVDGKPLQAVSQPSLIRFPMTDLTTKPSSEKNAEVSRIASIEAATPFDIAREHCLRAQIVKLSTEEHILLLSLHHIAFDGWSTGLLFSEIAQFYTATQTGKAAIVPSLPIQYADYASWQRRWLETGEFKKQLDYWKTTLAGELPVLELPTDRTRPSVQTFNGEWKIIELDRNLTHALKDLSKRNDCTLFMTLLSAYYVLLTRYSRQDDIIIGSPVANRKVEETEKLIGFFMNSVVLRIRPSSDPTFLELLKCVRETTVEALENQDVPFGTLVEEFCPKRSLSHNPIYQVMFVLQNTPVPSHELSGVSMSSQGIDSGTSLFDLTLNMWEEEGRLKGYFEFNTDLFDSGTIERMVGHYETLLGGIVDHPDQKMDHSGPTQKLSRISMLTDPEREQLLNEWNQTQVEFPSFTCVHHLIEESVKHHPESIALLSDDKHLTYAEFNQQANQLAHYLTSLGIGPDKLVGVCLERSMELSIALLAILKAGGAYVPLDPDLPKNGLAFMLDDTQAEVILTQERLKERIPSGRVKVLCLDSDSESWAHQATTNPTLALDADNLFNVIYTSGSTGRPKGVMVPHRGIINLLLLLKDAYLIDRNDRFLQKTPYSFDASVWELFLPMITGARLVYAKPEGDKDPEYIRDIIVEQGITTLNIAPSMLSIFLQTSDLEQCVSLRRVFCGGEALQMEHVRLFFERLSHTELHNQYGPTEASVLVSRFACQPNEPYRSVPIGKPTPNNQLYILDANLNPVPVGVTGELYIGGVQLARGYLNQAELTQSRFLENPYHREGHPSKRLYRTGDRARYLPDGNIEFIGRVDFQVKLRGLRIELGEIEFHLNQIESIDASLAIVREDRPGDRKLVAYLVAENDSAIPTHAELRQVLQEHLPLHMIPTAFVTLDNFPLTSNGKIDRRALPTPESDHSVLKSDFVPPRNSIEEQIADIWREVLRLERVGIQDNFFELGGDSIKSIQIIVHARKKGIHITPKQMFQHPTISELATVADETKPLEPDQSVVTGNVPLTPMHHWFHALNLSHPELWNQSHLFEVSLEFDLGRFQKSLDMIVMHHDALRMRNRHESSNIIQWDPEDIESTVISQYDLSSLPRETQKQELQELVYKHQANLCPREGKNIQAVYFDLGCKSLNRLLIVIHHLVAEAASWAIILEDLETVYHQLQNNQPIHLPEKTTSFKEWAQSLVAYAKSESLGGERNYWLEPEHAANKSLPLDFASDDNRESSTRVTTVCLELEETSQLFQEVPPVYNTKTDDILMTALLYAFSNWTNEQSLAIETEGYGREDIVTGTDLTRTVGGFISLYQIVLHLDDLSDYGRSVKIIKEKLHGVPKRGIGSQILRYLSPDKAVRDALEALPKADVRFNYLGQQDKRQGDRGLLRMTGESTGPRQHPENMRHHIIEINSIVSESQLRTDFCYSKNLHKTSTIEALAKAFNDHLKSIIKYCLAATAGEYTPSDFPEAGLNQEELDNLLHQLSE